MNAALSIPVPRLAADIFAPYTYLVVAVAMLFGGGARQGLWSDVFVEIAAMPLFAWAIFRLAPACVSGWSRWGLILLSAVLALPLLQLIPLPPSFWSMLPGRDAISAAYTAAGLSAPWLPLSLDPASTWRSLLALMPAAAVFLAMLSLQRRERRVVLALILTIVFASAFVDLLQTMSGPGSPLRFYAITNPDRAVGFFANANHNAAFLYCAIPFAAAWALGAVRDNRAYRVLVLTAMGMLVIMVIIGLAVTRSRAGLVFGCVGGLASLLLVWRYAHGQGGRRLLFAALGANAIALLVAFQFGFVNIMHRVEEADLVEDIRWPAAAVTARAAIANMPFGSGLGTFVPVFDMFSPRALLHERYVNHAHDDWLELWLTGGLPAILLVTAFLGWFGGAAFSVWHDAPAGAPLLDVALARAACLVIVLLLAHSVVDYPLRTAAMSVWFAIACACLLPELKPASLALRKDVSPGPGGTGVQQLG